jgi:hypothetical protein
MPLFFYVSDIVMLLFALAAAASALRQGRGKIVPRWALLLPSLFASIATVGTMIFPQPRDLLEPAMLTAGVLGFVIGGLRGYLMRMESDHNAGIVRLTYGKDALWSAIAFALFAIVHFIIEISRGDVSPYMASGVLLMTLTGSYLFGRSLTGWLHAGTIAHVGIHD